MLPSSLQITTPEPHGDIQRQIMQAFVTPGLEQICVSCGTKFGKSLAASSALAAGAPLRRGSRWRWVAPIYSQAKIGMRYLQRMLPPEPVTEVNRGDPSLSIPGLDVQLQFWHGTHPESLEGDAISGYVLDECSKMKEAVFASARTTTTVTRGPMLMISTPRGRNWFYKRCLAAQDEMERAAREGRPPRYLFLTAPTSSNPYVSPESIAEAKAVLPDRLFRQYYLAEFVDDGEVFIGFRNVIDSSLPEIDLTGAMQRWERTDSKELEVGIGADWAKLSDWTVFTAFDREGKLVGFRRFQGLSYIEAVKELIRFARCFRSVLQIKHDKTGIGEAIDDMLQTTDLPFHGLVFTNDLKASLVNGLILSVERKDVLFPPWVQLIREMESFEVTTTDVGRMRYAAAEGAHDDIIMSVCLGLQAIADYRTQADDRFKIRALEDLPKSNLTLERWYTEIIEETE